VLKVGPLTQGPTFFYSGFRTSFGNGRRVGWFRFVDLESGERLGGDGSGDLGDQAVLVVVDPPGGVGRLDGSKPLPPR
jgi:hypothetical protein